MPNPELNEVAYKFGGDKCKKDDGDCLAYSLFNAETAIYFVKAVNEGPEQGHLVNPNSAFYGKQTMTQGRLKYDFVRVSENVFGHYVNFLKTKNEACLHNAEKSKIYE